MIARTGLRLWRTSFLLAALLPLGLVSGCDAGPKKPEKPVDPPAPPSTRPLPPDPAPPRYTSGNWPQWCGPHRNNHSDDTGLLREWPKEGPRLAWRAAGIGEAFSSPVVWGNRLFVTGGVGDDCRVTAIDVDDGKTLWTRAIDAKFDRSSYKGPKATPATDGTLVYAVSGNGEIVALDVRDGRVIWKSGYSRFRGRSSGGWGFCSSPLLDGEKLVVQTGGPSTVWALHKQTGKPIWKSKSLGGASNSSVGVAELTTRGGRVVRFYLVLTPKKVSAILARDGNPFWVGGFQSKTSISFTPMTSNDRVFVSCGFAVGSKAFTLGVEGSRLVGKDAFTSKAIQERFSGAVLVGNHAYGTGRGRELACVDLTSGELKWSEPRIRESSLVSADGLIIAKGQMRVREVVLFDASPEGYRERGRFSLPAMTAKGFSIAQPVVAGGRLYIRDQDSLYCYELRSE